MTDTPIPPDRPAIVTVLPTTGQRASSQQAYPTPHAVDPKAEVKARLREKRRAKNAMVASLGALVFTGYLCARGSRRETETARMAHMVAGVALLGASYWHTTLYGPRNGGSRVR